MKLIAGLGNPGPKYQLTRHNVGFLLVDALVEVCGESSRPRAEYKSEFKAQTQKLKLQGETLLACKPQTFMNLSGESIQPLMKFYGIGVEDLLVVHDEIDIPFGHMRFQTRRGPGGHNGIRSVHQHLSSDAYSRLRLGVGRPPAFVNDQGEKTRPTMAVHDWVLQNFSPPEQSQLPAFLELAIQGIEVWVKQGTSQAATLFNNKKVG
ncbi:MAG: aminoacyl-tRNA hydrolase [Bdellovibrionales bacterium]